VALQQPHTQQINSETDLLPALRRYWGYDSFRPLQEKIVRSLLAGRDACVVMPTGGGKSLCYQLPAAMLAEKTAIVVSPLIALMQDQVAQLGQMGISAALLNSAVRAEEQRAVMRDALKGKYRLLYLSPERLAVESTVSWLQKVSISMFAIDEAHCISEWGHEFRPEYRLMSRLRQKFPEQPIAAFTASATQRVRHDIIEQLKLRDPHKCIASFHRPNLRYVVKECDARTQPGFLISALREYSGSNVIVYSPTVNQVGDTVSFLKEKGIKAIGYHGKMDANERRRNQELWMSDEVRVLVGTVAFGLGINKAAVRAVIHLSLPKSIEQFYQEAGRAGRDGLPADCILLWQKKDAGLLAYFIGKLTDPLEKERAWERYNTIRAFVESSNCRHRQICAHFGEEPKWKTCAACDVCGYKLESLAGAPAAKPARRDKRSSKHVTKRDVPEKRDSHRQSTFASNVSVKRTGEVLNAALYKYLREWRRAKSKDLGIAAFIIMHDTTLEDLCLKRPTSLSGLREVLGFGERKTELYGPEILQILREFDGTLLSERHYADEDEPPARPVPPRILNDEAKPRRKSGGWWGAR
jgi:ATP-dependent DNA helicase RecQ